MIRFVRSLFGWREPKNLEEELDRRFGRAMMPFVFVSFSAIYIYRLNAAGLKPQSFEEILAAEFWFRLLAFAKTAWPEVLLATGIFLWFIIYRNAVKNEIKFASEVFSKANIPHDLSGMVDREKLWTLQYGLIACFLCLAWFVTQIEIVCIVLLLLNMLDLRGNVMVRQNVERYLSDAKNAPPASDWQRPFIEQRRQIIRSYYIDRNHLERIFFMIAVNLSALLSTISDQLMGIHIWRSAANVLVILGIFINEVRILGWRVERDAALREIDSAEQATGKA